MTRKQLILLAMAGSAVLLLGAWTFQYFGYAPCKLCVYQRWPHGAAVVIGVLALWLPIAVLPLLGALAALTTAAVGLYHTGVERDWWQGPDTCTSGDITNLSTKDLMDQIMTAPLVQCDVVAWDLFGLSMANWNMLLSLGLVVIWIFAFKKNHAND